MKLEILVYNNKCKIIDWNKKWSDNNNNNNNNNYNNNNN